MKKMIRWGIWGLAVVGFSSCEKEGLTPFQALPAVNFMAESQAFSFLSNLKAEKDTVDIPVTIMGEAADYDRIVEAEAVADTITTATPEEYRILGGVVKAGEYDGKLWVEVKNKPQLENDELYLSLRLTDSQDFRAGNKESNRLKLMWTAKIIPPATWKAMSFFFCSTYSTQVYRVFIEVTGLTEFYYYEGQVTEEEGFVMAKKFGDYIRAYNAEHPGKPMKHDDGEKKGEEIVPLW